MLRPVVFDLDGVLVDSEPIYFDAFRSYMDLLGREDGAELFAITLGRREADFLPDLARQLGRSAKEIGAELDRALAPLLSGLSPMPAAKEVVESLRADGRPIALATSSLAPFATKALEAIGLANKFDAIITGDQVSSGKPDPEIYALAATRLNADPALCVAIEDTPAGIASAKDAGLTCVAVPHSLTGDGDLAAADAVVADLRAAATEIRRLDNFLG